MDSSRLSLVRAARIGPEPGHELVALGRAGARRPGRFVGFACWQGRDQQLRPTGRRLQKSDPAALGGGGGEKIRRDVLGRRHLSESVESVLAVADAVYL